jgi:hypothetical protein
MKSKKPGNKLVWVRQIREEERYFLVEVHPEATDDDILAAFDQSGLPCECDGDETDIKRDDFDVMQKKPTAEELRLYKKGDIGHELIAETAP